MILSWLIVSVEGEGVMGEVKRGSLIHPAGVSSPPPSAGVCVCFRPEAAAFSVAQH